MYCYWPSCSLGVKNKVKRGALPDKEKWAKYPIRVFVCLGMSDCVKYSVLRKLE